MQRDDKAFTAPSKLLLLFVQVLSAVAYFGIASRNMTPDVVQWRGCFPDQPH